VQLIGSSGRFSGLHSQSTTYGFMIYGTYYLKLQCTIHSATYTIIPFVIDWNQGKK